MFRGAGKTSIASPDFAEFGDKWDTSLQRALAADGRVQLHTPTVFVMLPLTSHPVYWVHPALWISSPQKPFI